MNNTRIAIYPGTFDPITLGHVDIIERSSKLFDQVVVTLAINVSKKPLFSIEERKEMIRDAVRNLPNVTVEQFDGLLVDFAKRMKASVIIRGLRAISDFEYEFQMALMNRHLADDITTVFLMPNEKYTYLNSTIIKDVANFGGNIDKFVTKLVALKLKEKLNTKGA
ncbi:MAG TPA: pantetheine-phosphate adenylyltransferase [Caldithrix abyssi]|uniref:Phosphopantetheine adenylyltransferase n=1 Tax=Caldithrix abyssi TaxID=187145 RepID=A0A7V5UE42_CALAY|nr:pantetheine-phosphate adenylyltransferase [Caldithrix abyssi]